jgi:hypothetical protein
MQKENNLIVKSVNQQKYNAKDAQVTANELKQKNV